MNTQYDRLEKIKILFDSKRIALIGDIKKEIASNSRMTVYRLLSHLKYLASYSHRGQFYTLPHIPDFDLNGLWSYKDAKFSKFGNLLDTAANLVQHSESGFTALELENLLQVETQHALLKLWRLKKVSRTKLGSHIVYFSTDSGEHRHQELIRKENMASYELSSGLINEHLPDELRAAIILFFSLLNEKQRRLFAGLEAAKLGHGGDIKIAKILGLDPHTVSKGRQELFSESLDRSGIRKQGGGRQPIEKKILK